MLLFMEIEEEREEKTFKQVFGQIRKLFKRILTISQPKGMRSPTIQHDHFFTVVKELLAVFAFVQRLLTFH